jgi:hypothetical protein
MKTNRRLSFVAVALFASFAAFAAEKEKELTLVGSGQCAKCALGKTESCQNALVVKQNGKEETYFLAQNAVSKDFHDNICEAPKQVKVTGTVKEVDGKKEITASKIELVKS